MIDNFPYFAGLVAHRFQALSKQGNLFETEVTGDALYDAYLKAFPQGTNPIFKERTEHDCSTCKQFIRRAGNVVAIADDGTLETVWDVAAEKAKPPYDVVAAALRDVVRDAAIADLFRVGKNEGSFGAESTLSGGETGRVLTWHHFYTGTILPAFRVEMPDQVRGEYRTTVQVFERGLKELKPEAVGTTFDLIHNNLYRGEEHKPALRGFQQAQNAYLQKSPAARAAFVWTADQRSARFRNTALGTLVQDLSAGLDVEDAVKSYEAKVAPTNYKRTTALITPLMVKNAMATIEELGLSPALERRFARIDDIGINDVKWVDNGVKPLMKGGLGDVLMQHAVASASKSTEDDEKRAENITLEAFMQRVLPETTSMEVLFKGNHLGNLMSLTAPVHPKPEQLFRWGNDFGWSYNGNIADSIKERVKRAGGNVTNAKLRVSLSWFNFDDLDLHIQEPDKTHIFFGSKVSYNSGGQLDVDMNAGGGTTREAVENVSWTKVPDGVFGVLVNNYSKREMTNVGFVVEVESGGKLSHFSYDKAVPNHGNISVVKLHVRNGVVERFEVGESSIRTTTASQEKWGLTTEQYIKVNAVTLSPNYWGDSAVGNKHTFFVLEGAKNDEPTRGIYNEFLHPRLEQHRKVFEVIGDKTKCQPTEGQLSGLGFSSTKRDSVVVKVTQGKAQRLFNVQIGANAPQESA